MNETPTFVLSDLSFAVAERSLLRGINMTLSPGRVTGLIGHNGSGKSTLMKLLARQLTPSGGSIVFVDRPLARWTPRAYARQVAYLPQTPPPGAGLKVAELVALGRYPWHGALGRFGLRDRARVEQAMALTDTTPFAGRLVETLSGGERQRVWLAMLVAQETRYLLLDEPISALDVAHQIEALTLIRRLSRDHGLGVVVVLHDVNMAARFCDDIVALHSGRLVDRGTPAEIMRPDRLERIYGIAMNTVQPQGAATPIAYAL